MSQLNSGKAEGGDARNSDPWEISHTYTTIDEENGKMSSQVKSGMIRVTPGNMARRFQDLTDIIDKVASSFHRLESRLEDRLSALEKKVSNMDERLGTLERGSKRPVETQPSPLPFPTPSQNIPQIVPEPIIHQIVPEPIIQVVSEPVETKGPQATKSEQSETKGPQATKSEQSETKGPQATKSEQSETKEPKKKQPTFQESARLKAEESTSKMKRPDPEATTPAATETIPEPITEPEVVAPVIIEPIPQPAVPITSEILEDQEEKLVLEMEQDESQTGVFEIFEDPHCRFRDERFLFDKGDVKELLVRILSSEGPIQLKTNCPYRRELQVKLSSATQSWVFWAILENGLLRCDRPEGFTVPAVMSV